MRDDFREMSYSVYLSEDGVLRLFFVSDGRLTIKSSSNYVSWKYEVFGQSIHKNYFNTKLNKGLTDDISNIQIVRNDYNKAIVSVLYFNNDMLFIRHFQTNELFTWNDTNGNIQDIDIKRHLEITDADTDADPPKMRTSNLPIFLVGVIPDDIKKSIKNDIDNNVPIEESDLAFVFPYKDPDTPNDANANKAMVDIFNENFKLDTNTQVYAFFTAEGLIRVFYKDSLGNIDGIIIDSLGSPTLEVMNVFNGS